MNTNRCNGRGRKAFTLLEVLLVIVILVTLAALVLPNLPGRREQAKIGTTKIQLKAIEDGLEYFKTDIGRYPTNEEGLEALISSDQLQDDELVKKWHGPYLKTKSAVKDAWGNDFHYSSPGEHNEKTFDLYSNGPDGQEGTDDDIVNWEQEED